MTGGILKLSTLQEKYLQVKRELFDLYYADLNEMQRSAVCTVHGPLLVLAGAGSGKTTVLVRRIVHILKYGNAYSCDSVPENLSEQILEACEAAKQLDHDALGGFLLRFSEDFCPPWAVLAITFTNKAAKEIKERLLAAFDDPQAADGIWAGTFHSICMRVLRSHIALLGYKPGFSIYDTGDQKTLVSACLKELNLDEKKFPAKNILNLISRAKDKLMTPEMLLAECETDYLVSIAAKVYKLYQQRLKEANALDFDDIIMLTVRLLEENPDVLAFYQSKFKYICVDEYQDTNHAQFRLTALLAEKHRNIMVVGDDDQSIYKFRGATIENILNFDRTYPEANIIKLEQNYRSTKCILDAANAVISQNFGRKGKTLWTNGADGHKVTVLVAGNQNDEARMIINKIISLSAAGRKYSDFAILYRMNAQSGVLESAFAKSGIPYRILSGVRFYDRREVKDILAYLFLIVNFDDTQRLKRIINVPKRKIGSATIDAAETISKELGVSLYDVIQNAAQYSAISRSALKFTEFCSMIRDLKILTDMIGVPEFVERVINTTGYRQMLVDEGQESEERLQNLEELVSMAAEYENRAEEPSLVGFLEEISLVADVDKYDENADAVVMMTIHSAKGLEFPVVFVPGMEDGMFPGMQSMDSTVELEEERRLMYVAITRAKKELYLLRACERFVYGKTQCNRESRFLTEIPDELKVTIGETKRPQSSLYGDHNSASGYAAGSSYAAKYGGVSRGSSSATEQFSTGDSVSHPIFGKGMILSVTQMGADLLYEVAFEKAGTKKLMATYARLSKK